MKRREGRTGSRTGLHWPWALGFTVLLCACGGEAETGSANIGVAINALTPTIVSSVRVTVSRSGIAPDLVHEGSCKNKSIK